MNYPVILSEKNFGESDLEKLKHANKTWRVLDLFDQQIAELFEILFPNKRSGQPSVSKFLENRLGTNSALKGSWVYYPWNGILIHMLNKKDYYLVRTNRNRDLVTIREQEKLKTFTVGIAGLSIGSNMAFTLAHLGVSSLKITDFDDLATSNLNRTLFGVHEVGINKAVLTAQKLYEIDPFIKLSISENRITKDSVRGFVSGKPKPKLIIDAIDDFEIKVRIRKEAKKEKTPVIMITNLGDSCLVDVERYDLDPKTKIFNGLLGSKTKEILNSTLTENDKQKFAAKIVGIEHIPNEALQSLSRIGKTLVSRPQLASSVSIGAGIASYIIRKITINKNWPSGRKLLHFDSGFLEKEDASKIYELSPDRKEILKRFGK